jgi:hypothetical protein
MIELMIDRSARHGKPCIVTVTVIFERPPLWPSHSRGDFYDIQVSLWGHILDL